MVSKQKQFVENTGREPRRIQSEGEKKRQTVHNDKVIIEEVQLERREASVVFFFFSTEDKLQSGF